MKYEMTDIKEAAQIIKKYGKAFTAIALSLILLLTTVVAYADEEEWVWDDEKKEEAWTFYTTTMWSQVNGLNFSVSSGGSVSSADVPDDFRTEYMPIITDILSDNNLSTVYYNAENSRDKTPYAELVLAMVYTLYDEGNRLALLNPEETDICFINEFFNENATIGSVEDSISYLFDRLILAERLYLNYHEDARNSYSIYSNDEYLSAVVQGTLYGSGYCSSAETYSEENAKEYYDAHESALQKKWNDFASDVLDRYSAIRSDADHTIIG